MQISRLITRIRSIRVPYKITFIITGIASTIWFLVRVIPKPSRATYPCMRAAAPIMSAFVIYLLGISASIFSLKKFRTSLKKSRYLAASVFLLISIVAFALIFVQDPKETIASVLNPMDNTFPVTSNEPIGEAQGLHPGRVVWIHDQRATNENYVPQNGSTDFWYSNDNADESVISEMLELSIIQYAGTQDISDAWDAIFRSFNQTHTRGDVGYTPGEKIAFKINLTNQSASINERPSRMDATPQLLNAILDQLVNVVGVAQSDITMGDPYREFRKEYRELVMSKYPDVYYVDGAGGNGVHQTVPSSEAVLKFSDKQYESTLPQQYLDATYVINIPCLKTHNEGGITLIAKNHQGSFLEKGDNPKSQFAINMHYSLPWNTRGDGKYRHTVDYMGHDQTGGKGLIYIIDGIWGGESWQGWIEKFKSEPFNDDYPNSIFVGQDPVALESVCYDILFQENIDDPAKDDYPIEMKVEIADYLSQCASSDYWPDGLDYDPEGDGSPMGSLGVFEHWNNPSERLYSRNLGTGEGIELITEKSNIDCVVTAPEAETIPVIDGDQADDCWAGTAWYGLDETWINWGEKIDSSDFYGRFKVSWSQPENLVYFFVEITDEAFIDGYTYPDGGYYNFDIVEVFFDEDMSGGTHDINNNAFAYHLAVNAPAEGGTETSFFACDLGAGWEIMDYAGHFPELALKKSGNSYLYEFSMKVFDDTYDHTNPEASRITLEEGKEMGLSMAYCDNDANDGERDNFFGSVWVPKNAYNDHWKNADGFGRVRLVSSEFVVNHAVEVTGAIPDYEIAGLNTDLVVYDNLLNVFSDPDGDPLTYSVNCDQENLAFSVSDHQLSVNASAPFSGAAEVTVVATDGEFEASTTFGITSGTIGISMKGSTAELRCYPNPVTDRLNVELNLVSGFTGSVQCQLYNMAGKHVTTSIPERIHGGKGRLILDLGTLPPGHYLLKVFAGNNEYTEALHKR